MNAIQHLAALISLCVLSGASAFADSETTTGIVHIRFGYTGGNFSSTDKAVSGSFNVPTTLDAEYELPRGPKTSLGFRFTLAHSLSQSQTYYMGTSVNGHYYLLSGLGGSRANEGEFSVESTPLWRLYVGWTAGISKVLVQSLGDVYEADSTLIEGGGNAGAMYQLSQTVALDLQLGATIGYGFSSVSVGAYILRAVLGLAVSL
jgi:hypothetical protein